MISISAEIDRAAVARLESLLQRVAAESPKRLAAETKRAAVYICQSLRKRTKVAPKRARASEMKAVPSALPPRYVHSNSAGRQLLRRWQLTRKLGTPAQYTKHHFVYTDAHRGKNGKMVGKSAAKERAELLRLHAGIPRRGLAKRSWGWVMAGLNGGGGDLSWKKTRGERRDPRGYVRGLFRAVSGGAFAEISNKLDYALDALRPGALNEAIAAASKRLEHNILDGRQTA